ncbi:MAG: hypothetical protein K0S78_4834 [Thermomicrobiales bacterium]|jgi:hypothetical protein|nr:hypothetical protein [Thermomicrobiales bacterium]
MTEQTLDQVARALSTGMPRRQVVKGVLGGAAAGAVALFGVRSSRAKSANSARQSAEKCCRTQYRKFTAICKQDGFTGVDDATFDCQPRNLEHASCFVFRVDCI